MSNEYNGWSNYETWLTNLWIDNDQGSQEFWQERTKELLEESGDSAEIDAAVRSLADDLKAVIKDGAPTDSGLYADLLGAAIASVNFDEIARHWMLDAVQERQQELTSGHMQLQEFEGDYYEVETDSGTDFVPADLVKGGGVWKDLFEPFISGDYESHTLKTGKLYRLSAPGYLDYTDWQEEPTEEHEELDKLLDWLNEMERRVSK